MNKRIFKSEFLRQQWLLYFITIISLLLVSAIRIVTYTNLSYTNGIYIQSYGLLLALSVVSIVLISIIIFSYMHSKEKLDLFHSLPITRTNLFLNKYLIGLSYFSISYFLTVLVMFTIDKVYRPELTSLNFGYILFLIKNWVFFVLVYTIFALANTIMGITSYAAFCGILLFFAPFILYDTYSALYDSLNVALNTPSLNLAFFGNYFSDIIHENLLDTSTYIKYISLMAILTILILILAISIYNKRESENSKNSVAVRKFEMPLKILILYIVFITTLLIVISWHSLSTLSAILIMLVVTIITVAIVEVIFNRSFKNINIKSLVFSTLIALCIVLVAFITAKIDIFDTKHYVPSEDSVDYIYISYNPQIFEGNFEKTYLADKDEIHEFYELTDKLIEVSSYEYPRTNTNYSELNVSYVTNNGAYIRYFYLDDKALINEILSIPNNKYKNSLTVANFSLTNFDTNIYLTDFANTTEWFRYKQNFDVDDRYPYYRSYEYSKYIYPDTESNERSGELVTALSTDISNILENNPTVQKYLPLMIYNVDFIVPRNSLNGIYINTNSLYITSEYEQTLEFLKDNNITIEKQTFSAYKITDEKTLKEFSNLVETNSYKEENKYYDNEEVLYNSEPVCNYIKDNMQLVESFDNSDNEKMLSYTVYTENLDDSDMLQDDTYILLNEYTGNVYRPNFKVVKKIK